MTADDLLFLALVFAAGAALIWVMLRTTLAGLIAWCRMRVRNLGRRTSADGKKKPDRR